MCAFRSSDVCAFRCTCHLEHALLLPRVYLQTVTLMQCNDYFYFRYFGSLFALNRMTPHWSTDYLCGCCHTWFIQLSPLFKMITSSLLLSLPHLLFLPPSQYLSAKVSSSQHPCLLFLMSSKPQQLYNLVTSIHFSPQALHFYTRLFLLVLLILFSRFL